MMNESGDDSGAIVEQQSALLARLRAITREKETSPEQWKALKTQCPAVSVGDWQQIERGVAAMLDEQQTLLYGYAWRAIREGLREGFAKSFLEHYSPGAIEEAADKQRLPFPGHNSRCWTKFKKLTERWNEESLALRVEREVLKIRPDWLWAEPPGA
jgi:hypothetical protein